MDRIVLAVLDLLFQILLRELLEGPWTKFPAFATMRLSRDERRVEGQRSLLSCKV
jgi:hypothetical protein